MRRTLPVCIALLFIAGITNPTSAEDKELLGSWEAVEMNGQKPIVKLTYTFKEKGTVVLESTVPDNPPDTIQATYKVDGKMLTIKFPEDFGGREQTSEYKIDKDTLSLVRDGGDGKKMTMTMKRMKE